MTSSPLPPPASGLEIVIERTRAWRILQPRELWAYRDLLALLVWRDFATRYKQTVLGPLWHVVQPLLTTLVFTLVFGRFARVPTSGIPPALFYLSGLLAWNYFAQTFTSTSNTLVANASLFGKVYFPRLVVPLAAACSNLIALGIQALTFAAVWIVFGLSAEDVPAPSWYLLLAPGVILHVAAFSFGAGLWLSALTTRYRDFNVIGGFLVQLWLYGTPVIYPFSAVPERWQWLIALNPMSMPVEALRLVLLGRGEPTAGAYALSVAVTAAVLVSGLMYFHRVERTFVDQA